ncbi:MAG: hypothetical protein RJA55_1419 [Acidobacteriota bacterium]
MRIGLGVMAAVLLTASVTAAQSNTDMATLERKVQDAQSALARVELTGNYRELKDLEDDLAYLRVKARRGETVTARERRDLSDRLDRYIARVGGISTTDDTSDNRDRDHRQKNNQQGNQSSRTIPADTELDVRLSAGLTSDTAKVEDAVEATTVVDLYRGDDLIVPAGSRLTGYVSSVERASRTDRKGSLTLQFTRLMVNGRTYDARGNVIQALESGGIKSELPGIAAGSGIGAIIGGILGGTKGAIAGILIGGGGVLAATEGKDVHLPEGTVLRIRFEAAVPLSR